MNITKFFGCLIVVWDEVATDYNKMAATPEDLLIYNRPYSAASPLLMLDVGWTSSAASRINVLWVSSLYIISKPTRSSNEVPWK